MKMMEMCINVVLRSIAQEPVKKREAFNNSYSAAGGGEEAAAALKILKYGIG